MLRPYKFGLQGTEEFEKGFFFLRFEPLKFLGNVFGFAVSLGLPGPVGVPASILAALVGAVLVSKLARIVPGRSPA